MKKTIIFFTLMMICVMAVSAHAEYKFADKWTWEDTGY